MKKIILTLFSCIFTINVNAESRSVVHAKIPQKVEITSSECFKEEGDLEYCLFYDKNKKMRIRSMQSMFNRCDFIVDVYSSNNIFIYSSEHYQDCNYQNEPNDWGSKKSTLLAATEDNPTIATIELVLPSSTKNSKHKSPLKRRITEVKSKFPRKTTALILPKTIILYSIVFDNSSDKMIFKAYDKTGKLILSTKYDERINNMFSYYFHDESGNKVKLGNDLEYRLNPAIIIATPDCPTSVKLDSIGKIIRAESSPLCDAYSKDDTSLDSQQHYAP